GSYAELGRDALGINPFDVGATAEALAHALEMEAEERARRARGLKASIRRNRLEDWVGRQVRDLERAAASRR
ncbi:MAG TPA: trehalose-6-phosphate synthase, partial [Actinomycetota bacterium]|nr:trehalose-6-phosphate synthase [Actinomycetota bacterium]